MSDSKSRLLKNLVCSLGVMLLVAGGLELTRGFVSTLYRGLFYSYSGEAPGTIQLSREYMTQGRHGKSRHFQIEYSYSVSGKPYYSNYVGHFDSTERVSEMVNKYRPGEDVTVHYNVAAPELSVLEKGSFSFMVYLSLALTLGMGLATFVAMPVYDA